MLSRISLRNRVEIIFAEQPLLILYSRLNDTFYTRQLRGREGVAAQSVDAIVWFFIQVGAFAFLSGGFNATTMAHNLVLFG
jgi:hypothetical protein